MRSKILVSFIAAMMLTGAVAFAGERAVAVNVEPAANAAAAQALKDLGRQPGARLAGMPALELMDKAAPGDGFAVKMVRLDDLQRFQPASLTQPEALLQDMQTVIYPIHVAGKLNGEMVMGKVGGTWSARGFAGPVRVQAMENVRGKVMSAAGVSAGATMLVRVPALNIELIGHRDAAGLQLTPVTDLPHAGLKAGQTLPAARVFELLAPLAKDHNGLPT